MKKTLALLIATTGLTAVLAGPALSAMQASLENVAQSAEWNTDAPQDASANILASDNDDDENEGNHRNRSGHDDDENGDDDDDDDDGCDDEKNCTGSRNPARAGDASPPENGLFRDGKAPKVDVN